MGLGSDPTDGNEEQEPHEWVVVGTFPQSVDLVYIEAALEDAGIRYFKKDELTIQVVPYLSQALGGCAYSCIHRIAMRRWPSSRRVDVVATKGDEVAADMSGPSHIPSIGAAGPFTFMRDTVRSKRPESTQCPRKKRSW
ncbi:MAG: hypothetical protein KDC00_06995 [Flavobacteriales bacterium]|nr:hypothetical protein [Flavobacteriales bacterium]